MSKSSLQQLQTNWEAWAQKDPLFSILTLPETKNGKWDQSQFFQTGIDEITSVMRRMMVSGLRPNSQKALDFGCGVGRLTQALTPYFDHVCGVDISPTMIKLANQYNAHGQRCSYFLNNKNDLSLFEDNSFDFIYSNIVLQHMKPELQRSYLTEFVRVLRPGGVAVCQTVQGRAIRNETELALSSKEFVRQIVNSIAAFTGFPPPFPKMDMHIFTESDVRSTLSGIDAKIDHVEELEWGKPIWRLFMYYIVHAD